MKFAIGAVLLTVVGVTAWWLPRIPDSVPVALFFVTATGVLVHATRGRKAGVR